MNSGPLGLAQWKRASSLQSKGLKSLLQHHSSKASILRRSCQASLSNTNSQSSLRLTSNESVMPSSHLILCRPLLLLPLIPPSIRIFSNESTLCMRWPKYWSFSFMMVKNLPGNAEDTGSVPGLGKLPGHWLWSIQGLVDKPSAQ